MDVVVTVWDLAPGDWITEVETPDGPWYRVVALTTESVTIDGRLSEEEPELLVTIPRGGSQEAVRRR